jgi:hypothetical protein
VQRHPTARSQLYSLEQVICFGEGGQRFYQKELILHLLAMKKITSHIFRGYSLLEIT